MIMSKFLQQLNSICANRYFPLIFAPIAICFLLLYSYTTSPLFSHDGMDSAVFKTMGLAWLRGYIPYQDIFDHKGPLLYFFNMLGQWIIPGRMGIFLLQCLFLTFTIVLWYRTVQLFTNSLVSFFVTLCALLVCGAVLQEGNQCEEWMLLFLSGALYTALKYFTQNSPTKTHPWSNSLIYGLCFGAAFLIRPNDAVSYVGGIMIGVSLYMLLRKEYKQWMYNVLSFVLGICCLVVPFVIYFASKHALGDLVYGLVGFNAEYSGGIFMLIKSIIGKSKLSLILLFIVLLVLAYNTERSKPTLWILIPITILETTLMGTSLFPHYYIVITPLLLVSMALIGAQYQKSIATLSVAVLCLSPIIDSRSLLKMSRKTFQQQLTCLIKHSNPNYLGAKEKRTGEDLSMGDFYAEAGKVLSFVPEEEQTEIWNLNLRWNNEGPFFSIFWHFQVVPCNKITYGRSEKLIKEDDLCAKQPKWVLCKTKTSIPSWGFDIDEKTDSVLATDYISVARGDTCVCPIVLYKKKQ